MHVVWAKLFLSAWWNGPRRHFGGLLECQGILSSFVPAALIVLQSKANLASAGAAYSVVAEHVYGRKNMFFDL
jgi:hypothetical protein